MPKNILKYVDFRIIIMRTLYSLTVLEILGGIDLEQKMKPRRS